MRFLIRPNFDIRKCAKTGEQSGIRGRGPSAWSQLASCDNLNDPGAGAPVRCHKTVKVAPPTKICIGVGSVTFMLLSVEVLK